MTNTSSSPPEISIYLSIDPPSFVRGSAEKPTLSTTATSHATQPVTIFTWATILNTKLSQTRKNFTCYDLTSDLPFFVEITKGPQRRGFTRTEGTPDADYFHTLDPEVPVTFTDIFRLSFRQTEEGIHALTEGHRYRYAVSEGEMARQWWYGRKEEVMAPAGERKPLLAASGAPIVFGPVAPVEFEVKPPDSA